MSYTLLDQSQHSAKPTALYKISLGETVWYYTNAGQLVNFNSQVYLPRSISHSEIPSGFELDGTNVEIKLANDLPICELLKRGTPSAVIAVSVYESNGDEYINTWNGRATNFSLKFPEVTLTTESVLTMAKRKVKHSIVSSRCTTNLFSAECKLSRPAFETARAVTAISGLILTVAATGKADGYFNGGMVEWVDTEFGVTERRAITSHVGLNIEMQNAPRALTVGIVVKLFPGCNHELAGDCHVKFNNTVNFRGQPFIKKSNPFNGNTAF